MKTNRNSKKAAIRRAKRTQELAGPIRELKQSQPLGNKDLPSPKEYGKLVRKYREQAGFTIQRLAEAVNMTRQSMSEIERGNRAIVDVELMYMIAVVLGCSIDNLLGITEEIGAISEECEDKESREDKEDKKKLKAAIIYAPPEDVDIASALLQFHRKHPIFEQQIIWLAKHGNDVILQKASDLLAIGLQEYFNESSFSTN